MFGFNGKGTVTLGGQPYQVLFNDNTICDYLIYAGTDDMAAFNDLFANGRVSPIKFRRFLALCIVSSEPIEAVEKLVGAADKAESEALLAVIMSGMPRANVGEAEGGEKKS